jgi:hypothetical protein
MSLLSIIKTVMDSNGWPMPVASVASSQDQNMRQSFALANLALKATSFRHNWPALIREHSFMTVPGQGEYALPEDFHHMVVPSAVNADQYYSLKGALTPIQWYRYSLNGGINWSEGFRIDAVAGKLIIAPTPGTPQQLVFMYITKNIAKSSEDVPQDAYYTDTDVSLIDEDLIQLALTWRWRQKKGLDYTAEMAEFSGTMKQRIAQYLGTGELPIGAPHGQYPPLTQGRIPDVIGV